MLPRTGPIHRSCLLAPGTLRSGPWNATRGQARRQSRATSPSTTQHVDGANAMEQAPLTEHQQATVKQARSLAPTDSPAPWVQQRMHFGEGGLLTAGWTRNDPPLLVSHSHFQVRHPRTYG